MLQQKTQIDRNTAQISSNSDKVIYDRFDADFTQKCAEIDIPEDELETVEVSCPVMSQLFLNMGFVRPDGSEAEQNMLGNIWHLAGGDELGQEKIPLQRIKVVMCAIQNFHIDWIIDHDRDGEEKNHGQIGRIDGPNLFLKSDEITLLTKRMLPLYKNRMDLLATEKKQSHRLKAIQKDKMGEQFKFKP